MIGTFALSIDLTMVRAELRRPPGVSRRITRALALPACAFAIELSMKSEVAGLIDPSMSMRSIQRSCGAAAGVEDAARPRPITNSITIAIDRAMRDADRGVGRIARPLPRGFTLTVRVLPSRY